MQRVQSAGPRSTKKDVLARLLHDAEARRELLWLRAKEKGDEAIASDLVRLEPKLVERLYTAGLDVSEHPGELPGERRERFGKLFDRRFDHYVRIFTRHPNL